jgi:hypothetical protein
MLASGLGDWKWVTGNGDWEGEAPMRVIGMGIWEGDLLLSILC